MDPTPRRPPPLPQLVVELRDLVVTYVKQQTLVPLKQLGRYVGFGVLGSLLLGFGVVFLAMSGLRALQTETNGTFSDDWSWVPYVIMIVVLALGGALVWLLRGRTRAGNEEAR
jgi:NO-binding membrane sensor protein with MHYT domain